MPCHVLSCECGRFAGDGEIFLCPVCSREYATRASLEIHLYGQHPGLTPRERSVLLQGALHPRRALISPSVPSALPRPVEIVET